MRRSDPRWPRSFRKKFIYDLRGDAVNTARRMESHGSNGTIQITRATYELIKGDFVCEPRGMVYVKGKGEKVKGKWRPGRFIAV